MLSNNTNIHSRSVGIPESVSLQENEELSDNPTTPAQEPASGTRPFLQASVALGRLRQHILQRSVLGQVQPDSDVEESVISSAENSASHPQEDNEIKMPPLGHPPRPPYDDLLLHRFSVVDGYFPWRVNRHLVRTQEHPLKH